MAGERSRPPAAPSSVGQRRPRRARRRRRRAARSTGSRSAPSRRRRGDRDGDAEPGAGRRAEQVRVGQRVAEDALVAAAGQGEHRADEQPEHHPGQPELGDDRDLALGQPASSHAGQQVEQLGRDAAGRQRDRPEREPGDDRDQHRDDAGDQPAPAAAAPAATSARSPAGGVGRRDARSRPSAPGPWRWRRRSTRRRSTTRGPQREAMSSSSSTTWPFLTAVSRPSRGAPRPSSARLLAALGVGQEDQVGVGLDERPRPRAAGSRRCPSVSAASAMFSRPTSA